MKKIIGLMDKGHQYVKAVRIVLNEESIKHEPEVVRIMRHLASLEKPVRAQIKKEELQALIQELDLQEEIARKKFEDENAPAIQRRDDLLPEED